MKAIRLAAVSPIAEAPLRLEEIATPQPGLGQILLRVHVCGVCHTDLHTVEGDLELPRLPLTPGHQVVGTVEALGEGASQFSPGERAGVGWLYRSCGECPACQSGQENLCARAEFTGLHADGGYAELMVVDEAYAYPLPEAFDDVAVAPLLCAGIIGFRSLRQSGIQPGQRLGLYGFGASAHIAIQVATYWDCEVYVFTRGEEHRQLARELGAVWVGGAEEEIDAPLDASVIFAPAGWIVPLALGHVRPGGTVAINAIHMSPIPEMPYQTIYGERVLRSVANFTRADAVDFLRLAAEIPVRTEVALFPLAEANDVLLRLKRSEIRGAAVLRVQPRSAS
ncbi:MAG: zinc-dependent alcohol dehydrogenase family protein [Anaerolineae bacterium]|nr:zinc-dependent alcohol dehydrogenase family protein [Anaerolineae bacterium]